MSGIVALTLWANPATAPRSVNVAIEHRGVASVELTLVSATAATLLSLKNTGVNAVVVSLPASMALIEVRGIPLAQLSSVVNGSYARWSISPGAEGEWNEPSRIDLLRIHNPSVAPIAIHHTSVDLKANRSAADVQLVQQGVLEVGGEK